MKAAVLHQAGARLILEEVDDPRPEPGQILIKVKACGVCHTDLHLAAGEWRLPKLPLILGHEVVGVVEAIGDGVTNFKPGDRAGVPWIYSTCGGCEFCSSDRQALCPAIVVTGFMADGGYAEYMAAPASHAVAVPTELAWVDAAPVYCAGLTPYRALKTSGARVGDTVVVWGAGGLGHYAIQIARAMGARVVAVDIDAAKLGLARELGADVTVNASSEKPEGAIRALGGAHVVLCLASSAPVIAQGFAALRRGGTLVLVGLPAGDFTLPILGTVAKGVRILTSAVGSRQDLREVLALAAAGKIKTVAETCRLDEINSALDRLRQGRVRGRMVIEM
ncbi:MAG TPA: alcohol dehydrogenase catalytic domain-containing protein [Terriglobia bacterium]|nr:alcohol dehydrogenase catalytic domain-containing protein [Terriglobia bacterium]